MGKSESEINARLYAIDHMGEGMETLIQIGDAEPGLYEDTQHGHCVIVTNREVSREIYGVRSDGTEIRNPDYTVRPLQGPVY